ncbi:MAG: GGDEF domain-containing protein [Acidimicrobiales bacterium]
MTDDVEVPEPRQDAVPAAVFDATRALLWVDSASDARQVAADLVYGLGGEVVPASAEHPDSIPADISFGDGEPLLPAAPASSTARTALDRYLARFLLDAHRAIELASRTQRLTEAATTDLLTGLPNRRILTRALGRLEGDDTVIMIDLDEFKEVNDTLGHEVGDDVLRAFGAVLMSTVRARDLVGRFGGEEFMVVVAPPVGADAFLHRLRAEWTASRPLSITFSAGIAHHTGDAHTTIRRADDALYQAKREGRNRWVWATPVPASTTPTDVDDDPGRSDQVSG